METARSEKAPGEKVICLYPGCEQRGRRRPAQGQRPDAAGPAPALLRRTRSTTPASTYQALKRLEKARRRELTRRPRRHRRLIAPARAHGTKRSAGTPPPRASIARVASGIVTKRRSASADGVRSSGRSVLTYHRPEIGVPRTSSSTSAPRSSSSRTVCAIASVTPRPGGDLRERGGDVRIRRACAAARSPGARGTRRSRSTRSFSNGPEQPRRADERRRREPLATPPACGRAPRRRRARSAGTARTRSPARPRGATRGPSVMSTCRWPAARRTRAPRATCSVDLDAGMAAAEGVEQRLGRELGERSASPRRAASSARARASRTARARLVGERRGSRSRRSPGAVRRASARARRRCARRASSPSSRRNAPTAPDTAGSETSSARAAALTEPSRATVRKDAKLR